MGTPPGSWARDECGVARQAELGRRYSMDRSDVVAAITELAEQGSSSGRRTRMTKTQTW
ncbi:MAG TPA: hypothetical protein VG325_00390 [Solirubrobacteraceae bacterium]|nr:hypothetical protein [Solirubrobacteraceae bacterium]